MTIAAFVAAWLAGGYLLLAGGARHTPNADGLACLVALRRGDPAAIVAVLAILAIWPAVFVFAKLTK